MRCEQLRQALLFAGKNYEPTSLHLEKKEAMTHINPNPRTYAHSCWVGTTRWGIPDLRLGVLTLITSLVLGGCSTHLGYVPHDYYAPSFRQNVDASSLPSYPDVKNWAFKVADGYDTRATLNRQAVYGGALTALAATSALVGLAAFDPGSSAIIGIPIGTTFLSGTMALYNNEQKAVIYGSASQTIRNLLIQSDCRKKVKSCDDEKAAVCLRAEVSQVMGKVESHITLLDPKNVADMLKGVASSIAEKKALVARKQKRVDEVARKATAPDANKELQDELKKAQDELKKAQDDLQAPLDNDTVDTLSEAANKFDDLKEVPNLCKTSNLCETPSECLFTK